MFLVFIMMILMRMTFLVVDDVNDDGAAADNGDYLVICLFIY